MSHSDFPQVFYSVLFGASLFERDKLGGGPEISIQQHVKGKLNI